MLVVRKRKGFHQLDDFRAIDADESGKLSDQSGNWCSSDWPTDLVKHLSRPSSTKSPTNPPNHRKPTSQEELDLCCYQKCGFQPFQHPSLQLPKGLSAPDPPPWCRKRKQFFKGVQIWNYKMRGVRTMHVCVYSVFGGGRLWKSAKRNFLFQPKPTKQGSQRWNNGC